METNEEIQKQCEEIGLYFTKLPEAAKQFKYDGLAVELDLFGEADTKWLDGMLIEKTTGRKDMIYLWFEKQAMQGVTTMKIAQPFKNSSDQSFFTSAWVRGLNEPIANGFADFCWYHADGTTPETGQEIVTPFRENCTKGDLTRFLTCRFADNLVDICQTLNQTFFEGIMFDSILYGPYIVRVGEEITTLKKAI